MRHTTFIVGSLALAVATTWSAPITGQQGSSDQQVARADDGKKSSRRLKVDKKATRDARKFRGLEIAGEQVAINVDRVTDRLHWYKSFSTALQVARGKNKPLLWIQALGDLEGFL